MGKHKRFGVLVGLALLTLFVGGYPAWADGPTASEVKGELKIMLDTVWVLVTAFLVFFMNLGFGCVEAGFCRAKNATNILGKNFVVFALCSLAYWAVGWGLMFGDGTPYIGQTGWFVNGVDNSTQSTKLGSLIKDDIKEKYKLDLADAKVKEDKKYEPLLKEIEDLQSKAQTTVKKDDEKFSVKVNVPDHGVFEKEYGAKDFYWGVFSAISWAGVPLMAKFFFQLVFAGTAATIVSGCVAERIHYKSFMVFALFIGAVSYPITGHWIWGGGWLSTLETPFWDFAGSTVVHCVGGWAGLAGIIVLGPRLGKFRSNGTIQPIPGHSMALGFIGAMVLWFGWFGFNPGSTMAVDPAAISKIVITTNMACAAGMVVATIVAWIVLGKPDFSMTVNGSLAGLVAVTAPCAWVSPISAVIIGSVGGALVVFAVLLFDKLKIDDPVGALSVHLVNGIWGTLAVGLFSEGADGGPAKGLFLGGNASQLTTQLTGLAAVAAFTFAGSMVVWILIRVTLGLRVDAEDEVAGLDVTEMGMEAYNGFQVSDPHEHMGSSQEPHAASAPPAGPRFSIVVEGAKNGELMEIWSDLCQPVSANNPAFDTVYSNVTTVKDNRFDFRGGDPAVIRQKLEELFKGRMKGAVKASIVNN